MGILSFVKNKLSKKEELGIEENLPETPDFTSEINEPISGHDKDYEERDKFDLLRTKLDLINSRLDSIDRRLERIEKIAEESR